jgi:hypothetical protein
MANMANEFMLDLGMGQGSAWQMGQQDPFVRRASDPVSPTAGTPADFSAQFPQPLDTTELVTMCEEIGLWKALPEIPTALQAETWRELTSLAFTSGSSYLTFADGLCPEEFYHGGANRTITLKNLGAHKSLTLSDIMHSQAVAAAGWNGINRIVGGFQFGEGMPGGNDVGTFQAEAVADLKAKEMVLAGVLVLNGWDNLLVNGNATSNPLEFDGLAQQLTATGSHSRSAAALLASGTFAAIDFDRFLSEGCAKPDTLVGHPQAIQELMTAYFSLGFQGSQLLYKTDGNRMVPGYNFAGEVNTGIGALKCIADRHFTLSAGASSTYTSKIYALRMVHNGEPLVYKRTQIPFSFRDLVPGCTAISFEIWAKTALIVKAICAHGVYDTVMSGRSVTVCPTI